MHESEIPESVREYFGHDKVALFGTGGLPAAPPAPPGSPARRQGEEALREALSHVGEPGRRPGDRPAAPLPRPSLPQRLRSVGERALSDRSMRELGSRVGSPAPRTGAGWFWRTAFVPVYRAIPWAVRRRMVSIASGVRGWRG